MKGFKKRVCKVLSVVLSVMMTVSAFSGFSTTSVSAATVSDQSGNFIYTELEDGTIEITSCNLVGEVEIPSYIDGKKVTTIGGYAFGGEGIESVTIPETVVTIQENAFYNCDALKEVNFSEGLKYIGGNAFYGCPISKLTFPETLEEIADYAFESNYVIDELNFPKTRGVKLGNSSITRGPWYYASNDGPIISGKTFVCYKAYGTYVEKYTIPDGIETISCNAFSDLYSLKEIEIPDTVKYIGSGAFAYTDISEIVIPDAVEVINDEVFQGCEYLEKVTFSDKITYIGNMAFEYCEKLSGEFVIPEDVTYIGYNAFYGTSYSNFEFSENNQVTYVGDGAFDYSDWYDAQPDGLCYIDDVFLGIKSSDDVMPESVVIKDGTRVIAGNALMYCDTDITVPDSVKYINDYAFAYSSATDDAISANAVEIGDNAFMYCSNITELNISKSLKTIGSYAFDSCSNLTTVTEFDNLISIGDYAFRSTGIATFPVGSDLEKIGVGVFQDNQKLEKFTVDSNNKKFSAKNDVLYNKDQTIMICYPPLKKDTTLVITPDILDFRSAFVSGNSYITEIIVEEGVRNIPERAFEYLPNVEEITISSTVSKIGCYLFSYNCALKTINFNAVNCYAGASFQDCDNLTTVNIGEEVTVISDSMFSLCRNLENVNFGGNVEFIGNEAFGTTKWDENIRNNCAEGEMVYVDKVLYCSNNVSGDVTIKDGTKSIYKDVFNNYTYSSNITSVTIPDSVVRIGDYAFSHCNNLKSVKMSSNIEHIGNYAFNMCSNMGSVDLGNKLTFLGEGAFNSCSSMKNVTIPSGIKEIFSDTFSGCSQLTNVTLNEGIEIIGSYSFSYTKSLESIKMPSTVEKIDYEAFAESGIKNVELNEGLESIDGYAFSYCEQLESINFPSTLKSIGYEAFYRCVSLKKAELNEGLETLGNCAFDSCSSIESVVIPSSLEFVGYDTFTYCTSLKNVTLNEGVESIGSYAFYGCTALESIVFPSTMEYVDYDAFSNCSSLKNVTLNEGLTYIGGSAFYGTAIESIEIPTTLTEVYYGVFSNCTQLKSVTLKEGLINIYDGAFYNCPSLEEILIPSTVDYISPSAFDKNMTIHGYTGSYAQSYVEYKWYDESLTHTFVEIERILGDVNGDGTVNVTDVTELQKYLAGMTTLTQKQLASSDVTEVSDICKIDIKDASYIAKAIAGFCEL